MHLYVSKYMYIYIYCPYILVCLDSYICLCTCVDLHNRIYIEVVCCNVEILACYGAPARAKVATEDHDRQQEATRQEHCIELGQKEVAKKHTAYLKHMMTYNRYVKTYADVVKLVQLYMAILILVMNKDIEKKKG